MGIKEKIMPEHSEKTVFFAVFLILLLPLFLLPPTFNSSDWNRAMIFRIIISCILFLFAWRYLSKNKLHIKKMSSPLALIVMGIYMFIITVSAVFSADPRFSFFGSPARSGGILTMLALFAFLWFLIKTVKGDDWIKLWRLNFFVGIMSVIFAVMQYFHIFGSLFLEYAGSPPAFFGNSTFLAIYLLFLTFAAASFFFKARDKKSKIKYAAIIFIFLLGIFLTGSRATYLGVLIGIIYLILFYPIQDGEPINMRRYRTIAWAAVLGATIIVAVFNFFPQQLSGNPFLSRVVNRLSIKTVLVDLGQTRLSAWTTAIEIIKEKPLLGMGPENMQIGFEKYYNPGLPNMLGLWFDRAHNLFLDIAGSTGIPSLLVYSVFWLILLIQLKRAKKQSLNRKIFIHSLQAAFIAYLVAMMFNFDSFSTYLMLFFNIGFAIYLISDERNTAEKQQQKNYIKYNAGLRYFLAGCLILFVFFLALKPLYANIEIQMAKNFVAQKKCDKALATTEDAIKNAQTIGSYARLNYADFIRTCSSINPEKQSAYALSGEKKLEESIKLQPKYTRSWIFLSGFKNYIANRETNPDLQKTILAEAENYANQALKLSPKRQDALQELMKNHLIAKDYQKVKEEAEYCKSLNDNFAGCYWYLGVSELYLGDINQGKENIKTANLKMYPVHSTPSLILLANIYIPLQDYEELVWIYQDLSSLNPDNIQYHASLALVYGKIGKYADSINQAVMFLKLSPNSKAEVQEFVSALTGLKSDDYKYHLSLAYLYKEFGEYEKAKLEINLSFSLLRKSPEARGDPSFIADAQKELDTLLKDISDLENIK